MGRPVPAIVMPLPRPSNAPKLTFPGRFGPRTTRRKDHRAMVRKKLTKSRKSRCRFCTKEGCPRPAFVDYKDVATLKKLTNVQGKMLSRKRTGTCAAFQRAI